MGVLKNDVGRPSKKTKIIRGILKLIGILIIVAAGLYIGYIIGNSQNKEEEKTDKKKTEVKENKENEVKELDVNDPLIRELYGYFNNLGGCPIEKDFYTKNGALSENISDEFILTIAALNTEAKECKEDYLGDNNYWPCYEVTDLNENAMKIFGKQLNIKSDTILYNNCESYTYSESNNEFYNIGSFGSSFSFIRNIYKATELNNKIYLYEVVATEDMEENLLDSTGTNKINLNSKLTKDNITNYKDKLENFKWTFDKNEDGNYVFEKVEKID